MPQALIFNTDMQISKRLLDKLEEMKKFQISNQEESQKYMASKGIMLFSDLAPNLEKHSSHFDKNDKHESDGVNHLAGEKFNINTDHDFKEWEQYDIVHGEHDKTVPIDKVPKYIHELLKKGPSQKIDYQMITVAKSG